MSYEQSWQTAFVSFGFVFGLAICSGQELTIPTPEGTSEESIQRIQDLYKKEIETFGELLFELDRNRFLQPKDGLRLPVPASADKDSVNRVRINFDKQVLKFSEFLFEMDNKRLRPEVDSLTSFNEKQIALTRALSTWYSGLRNEISSDAKLLMNYVYICNAVCPRLSGRVLEVGPDSEYKTLQAAISNSKPGDTLQLEPGNIDTGKIGNSQDKMQDIEIRGDQSGSTILVDDGWRYSRQLLNRVRFMNITFDCQNNQISLGSGARVEFRNCTLFNYNSGAGGSNGLAGSNIVLLAENCLFEGKSGRAANGSGGNAFDFRGNDYLYLRNTKFVDNCRISFQNAIVDNCKISVSDPEHPAARFQHVTGNIIKVRNSELGRSGYRRGSEFAIAFDDKEFFQAVRRSITENTDVPEELLEVIEQLKLRHNLQYWIGMIRATDPKIRNFSAKRVAQLSGKKVSIPKPKELTDEMKEQISSLITKLNGRKAKERQAATEKLKELGESAEDQLRQVLESGTIEQKARSKVILDLIVESRNTEIEKIIGQLLNWYDEKGHELYYDESSDSYLLDQ